MLLAMLAFGCDNDGVMTTGPDAGRAGADGGPVCGNGVLESDEVCDGALVGDATCDSLGLGGGTLGC